MPYSHYLCNYLASATVAPKPYVTVQEISLLTRSQCTFYLSSATGHQLSVVCIAASNIIAYIHMNKLKTWAMLPCALSKHTFMTRIHTSCWNGPLDNSVRHVEHAHRLSKQ